MEPELSEKGSLEQNFRVEYVLLYSIKDGDKSAVSHQFTRLLQSLAGVGLDVAVRPADESSLLLFVRAPNKPLLKAVHSARTRDWLYGVRQTQPGTDGNGNGGSHEPQTEAEHLRTVYELITLPKEEGGAGINPKQGEWTHLEAIFPLHNHQLNTEWIKSWSKKTFLSQKDLDQIRARFGERVAFYFAFLQAYFAFLMIPAALGFASWALLGPYSVTFSVLNALACLVFVEAWKRQETELALRWDVKGVSAIPLRRKEFRPTREVKDPITGETTPVFPTRERLKRQLLQLPFGLLSILALGSLIVTCFGIEIFLSELYSGPFQSILVFIPTVLLTLLIPRISQALTVVAKQLNDYENYLTQGEYDAALTRKLFVLNFVTSYLPVLLTAFVYLPFGHVIVPYLDVLNWFVRPLQSKTKHKGKPPSGKAEAMGSASKFSANRSRLKKQVIYFAITAQVVSLATETIVPYVQRKVLAKFKGDQQKPDQPEKEDTPYTRLGDIPDEESLLKRARNEAKLTNYDVDADLREMCVQFGYLALFSPVWPLVPLFFLLNNWLELRSDFIKICNECRRPTPLRADSIGPWLDSLSFLAWAGSITSTALVYLFGSHDAVSGQDTEVKGWVLLLAIFLAEHGFFVVRMAVAFAFNKLETPGVKKDRAQRYMLRKKYLESAAQDGNENVREPEDVAEQKVDKAQTDGLSHADLEQEARRLSMHNASPADQFWARQHGWKEAAQVGVGLIQSSGPSKAEKKKQ